MKEPPPTIVPIRGSGQEGDLFKETRKVVRIKDIA
jgi:hypothetical protein